MGDDLDTKAPWHIVLLFAACGVGSSLSVSAVLSSLVFYKKLFGSSMFFVLVNIAIYAPLVPMSLSQARWDVQFDAKYGTKWAFAFRGVLAFGCATLVTFFLPLGNSSVALLCSMCFVLGVSSAVLVGSLTQLASFVSPPSCGRNQAAYWFGYQASGVVVLIFSLYTTFGQGKGGAHEVLFYNCIGIVNSLCFVCFIALVLGTEASQYAMNRRDSEMNISDVEDAADAKMPLLSDNNKDDVSGLTYLQLLNKARTCCGCLIVSVATNMAMTAWLANVQTPIMMLPQVLFFTRIFADSIGRPVSVGIPVKSVGALFWVALFRLLLVPIFFVSASDPFIHDDQVNAALLIVLVTTIASLSGYVTTASYQLAPTVLDEDAGRGKSNKNAVTKQASLLNICFSTAALLGVSSSLVLQLIVMR